jgi:hypothetical protein
LILLVPVFDRPGFFKQAVGERGFAVIDVGNNAKVSGIL